jgi:hypothetical protein
LLLQAAVGLEVVRAVVVEPEDFALELVLL